jgi:hypothetical protein
MIYLVLKLIRQVPGSSWVMKCEDAALKSRGKVLIFKRESTAQLKTKYNFP